MSESIGNFKDPKIVAVIKKLQDMAKALSMSDNKHSIEQLLEAITLKAFTESWNLAMERAEELIEENDPRGAQANPHYWGRTLRTAINKEKV